MTKQAPPDDEVHVCKPGATTYYCPTAGKVESDCHGGFNVCCAHPELHRPEDDDPEALRARLAEVEDARDRARRWAVHLENENRRLADETRAAKEQARVATVAALNLQQQTPDAAQRTLGRIRAARTWVAVWVELGQHFGLTAEQAGLEARSRRVGEGL